MKSLLAAIALVLGLVQATGASAQSPAPASNLSPETVTVVIQMTLVPGAKADAAGAAMADMRAMIRKQPGFLSDELLQNVNPANSPTTVYVSRWASLKYWERVFVGPSEFARLHAAGTKYYTIAASAFKVVE
jgi:heme-degrading monooxygenase HmoA